MKALRWLLEGALEAAEFVALIVIATLLLVFASRVVVMVDQYIQGRMNW